MSRAFELYHYLSRLRFPKSEKEILEHFQCSKSSFDRAKRVLREEFGITVLPPSNGGYKLLDEDKNRIEIGGILMTQQELIDLLQIIKLLQPVAEKNHLNEMMNPILQRLLSILPVEYANKLDFIDALSHGERYQSNHCFQKILSAFHNGKRLNIQYKARSGSMQNKNEHEREISPQKLLRYRSNWYLIAWCHYRKGLRTFSIEKIDRAEIIDTDIDTLPKQDVEQHYTQTYGIFSGKKLEMAELKFSPPLSQWVRDECWHPQQKGTLLDDDCYHLSIPIGENLTELTMQLAMYGNNVTVLSPKRLKVALIKHHQESINVLKQKEK